MTGRIGGDRGHEGVEVGAHLAQEVEHGVGVGLEDLLPQPGVAARVGGDEFVILLPGATLAEADPVMERIRTAVRAPVGRLRRGVAHPTMGAMSHTVVAELVAAVMKVEVAVGQRVIAEDPVVILESMKMEIPVLTEFAGTVEALHVVEGEVLQEGDLIATVAAD